jgi:hypothetical protein
MGLLSRSGAALFISVILCACQQPTGKSTAAAKPNRAQKRKPSGPAAIFCEKPVHDYGTVNQGDKVQHVFVIKNRGGKTLNIQRVAGG